MSDRNSGNVSSDHKCVRVWLVRACVRKKKEENEKERERG